VLLITEADGTAGEGGAPVDAERIRALLSALPADLVLVDVALPAEAVLSSLPEASAAARLLSLACGGAAETPAPVPLTRREQEVLALIEQGLANKEIARRLGIGLPTVKNHVHSLLEKLGARSRGQAAARARRQGMRPAGGPPPASPDPYRPPARAVESRHVRDEQDIHDPHPHRGDAGDARRHHRGAGGRGSGHDGHRPDREA
jgi:DNA-binding CsgD family transcriptional regulator